MSEVRCVSGFRARHPPPAIELARALDVALEVHAPFLHARAGESELREGDAHLHRPSLLVDVRGDVPHGVPRIVGRGIVVGGDAIGAHAGGIDGESKGGAMVVVRVDVDAEEVAAGGRIPAAEPRDDARGVVVVQSRGDVERIAIVRDHHVGALPRLGAIARLDLPESGGAFRGRPHGVAQAAVDRRTLARGAGGDGGNAAVDDDDRGDDQRNQHLILPAAPRGDPRARRDARGRDRHRAPPRRASRWRPRAWPGRADRRRTASRSRTGATCRRR